jgi:hypothetical protein
MALGLTTRDQLPVVAPAGRETNVGPCAGMNADGSARGEPPITVLRATLQDYQGRPTSGYRGA